LAQPPAKKKRMVRELVYPKDPILGIRVRVRDSIQFRIGDFCSFSYLGLSVFNLRLSLEGSLVSLSTTWSPFLCWLGQLLVGWET
jgi:hypothetical protein